jgi:signal transduction histidine kinase
MRETVWALNPKHDTLERLARFLEERVEEFVTGAGLRCRLQLPDCFPELVVPSPARHQISLVVKEALHNAVKHAGAREIRFRLEITGNDLCLQIVDDGRGFCSAAEAEQATAELPVSSGNGLTNMRDRVESLGGSLALESSAGSGTAVNVRIPLRSFRTLST